MSWFEHLDWILPDGVVDPAARPEAVLLGAAAYAAVRRIAEDLGRPLDQVSRWPGVPIVRGSDRVPPNTCVRVWGMAAALDDAEMRACFDEADPAFRALVAVDLRAG